MILLHCYVSQCKLNKNRKKKYVQYYIHDSHRETHKEHAHTWVSSEIIAF